MNFLIVKAMGNLSGKAFSRDEYIFKKKHPIRWWFVNKLRSLERKFTGDKNLYIRKDIK